MLLELKNCRVIDTGSKVETGLTSVWVRDGIIVTRPPQDPADNQNPADNQIDLMGGLVMAGGIDLHTHIGGGKVNLARMLMAEQPRSRNTSTVWPTVRNGELYAKMGYTTCFEPAMILSQARHTHLELADTPLLDTGAYVVLGNEDWLLAALGKGLEDASLRSLVAWSVSATQALAVKVVNAGGINAFKFNRRALEVDEPHPVYGVSPRDVIRRLSAAVDDLQLPHPLHVHASNLGAPGNIASTLATLDAAEGRRLHLTHAQFNCYSGPFSSDDVGYAMGSGAEQLSRYVNTHPNISLDVGQVVFGQTVTISADEGAQYRNRIHAHPKRWIVSDTECQAGCGVVPMRYSDRHYVHSLQWTIGLELLLLIEDPWRVFLTTDHPNGGPFTSYPHLIRLLMDRDFRLAKLGEIHSQAAQRSVLQEIDREYTLEEIAIITRAAPAKILGLLDRGSLEPGKRADIVAYRPRADWEDTFSQAQLLLKGGLEVVRDGQLTGALATKATLAARPAFDSSDVRHWYRDIESWLHLPADSLSISDDELAEIGGLAAARQQ